MKLSSSFKWSLALIMVLGLTQVRAEEDIADEEEVEIFDDDELEIDLEEEEDYVIGPSPDITTAVVFPDYPDNKLEIGEVVKMAFVVSNKGEETFNVTTVFGALRSPFDYDYHIQNLSVMPQSVLVPADTEASLEYYFRTDPRLEPTKFWLSSEMFYNSTLTKRTYKSTIFNQTIELVEKNHGTDYVRIFKYIMGIAAIAFAVNVYQNSDKYFSAGGGGGLKQTAIEDFPDEKFEVTGQSKNEDGSVKERKVGRKRGSKKGGKKRGKK